VYPVYPAGLALLPLASPPYGPPDKSLFVRHKKHEKGIGHTMRG
jgi:hypothetical protein